MKAVILLCTLAMASLPALGAPSEAQKAACKAKVERVISATGKVLGMGNGVGHLGGAEITGSKKLEGGTLVYIYSGGVLSANNVDGYLSGTGAETEVIFNGTGCEISKISINTGADYRR